jgi:hypothetical protein
MKEARIECVVAGGHIIDDLGLRLRKNQVVWDADLDKIRKSKDLKRAKRLGAVQIRFEERCRVAKKLPTPPRYLPPSVRRSRPTRAPPAPPQAPKAEIGMEEVARRAEAAAAGAVEKAMSQLAQQPSISQGMLEDALRNVLGAGGFPAPSAPTAARPAAVHDEEEDEPEPVFIPKGIVPTDAKSSISTKEETVEAPGLDGAAAALKAARPKRKRKPRTKKTEK